MTRCPQVLVNVRVARRVDLERARRAAGGGAARRGRAGRRRAGCSCAASGTEPVVRVMVEARRREAAEAAAGRPQLDGRASGPEFGRRSSSAASTTGRSVMCGIVAVVRRPPAVRDRPICAALARASSTRSTRTCAAPTLDRDVDVARRRRPSRLRAVDAALRAGRRRRGAARRAGRGASRSSTGPTELARAALDRDRGARSTPTAARPSATTSRRVNAALVACKDAVWAVRARPARAAARDRGSRPAARRPGRRRSAAYHSIQIALSALDRLEVRGRDSAGLHVLVAGHGLDLADPTSRGSSPSARRDPLFTSGSVRVADGHARVRLQDRGRDRRARRQHRARCARRSATTSCCASRCARRRRAASRCSRTRAGRASGSSPKPNAHPLNQRGDRRRRRGPVRRPRALNGDVDNYADLKALEALAAPAGDHHRRQGDPGARSRAASRPASSVVEAFRATVASFEGSVAIARAVAGATPTTSCSRCAAAARRSTSGLARRLLRGRERAVRRSSRSATRYLRLDGETHARAREPGDRRARSSCSTRRDAGDARRYQPPVATTAARCRSPKPSCRRRRSRRATSTAATRRTTCSRRSPRRRRRSARRCAAGSSSATDGSTCGSRPRRCRPRCSSALRAGAIRRVLVIGQGTARDRGPESRRRAARARSATDRLPVEALTATELSGFGLARRHERHARRRDLAVGHHHRHEPHRRPRARAAARSWSRSSTGARATSSTRATACSTRPTVATSR